MRRTKELAYNILAKHRIFTPTIENVMDMIKKQGFHIQKYSHIENTSQIEILLRNLDVFEFSKTVPSFTFIDDKFKIVFMLENLSEDEEYLLLCHELGHIICDNPSKGVVASNHIVEECDAAEFAHCLRNPGILHKAAVFVKTYGIKLAAALILVLCMIPTALLLNTKPSDQSTTANIANITAVNNQVSELEIHEYFYITPKGNRYHLIDCIHVKDKDNLMMVPEKVAFKLGYTPCKNCLHNRSIE